MNSKKFAKGDILEARHRQLEKGYHYIVYYEGHSDSDFIGAMLTHHENDQNVKMAEEHFVNDEEYKVKYDATFLVRGKFIKSEGWGPFMKVGQLTKNGITFLEGVMGKLRPETFANYYRRNKNKNNG